MYELKVMQFSPKHKLLCDSFGKPWSMSFTPNMENSKTNAICYTVVTDL